MSRLNRFEIRKDAVQEAVVAMATATSQISLTVTGAVKEIAGSLGGFASELFEIRESARRAMDDNVVDED